MSSNLPIVRDNRVRDRLAAVGQTVFTFDAPLFDAADLRVFVKTPATAYYIQQTTGFTVELLAGNVGATVTFAAPLVAAGSAALVFVRLQGARVPDRLLNVTRGGVLRSQALEAELDRQTLVLQELRRDLDGVEDASQTAAQAADTATNAAATAVEKAGLAIDAATRAEAAAGTVEGAVSYAVEQHLSPEQQALAQKNLGLDDLQNALTPFGFTADAGQTVFNLGMSPSANACIVSMNGAWLIGGGVDYAIAGTALTLTVPAVAGDRIAGVAIASFEVANALLPASNLADLADIAAARNNLGLKSAATKVAGDPLLMPSGSVIGSAYGEYTLSVAHTALIPNDSSYPQITEGEQVIEVKYTPKIAGSKLRVRFSSTVSGNTASASAVAALFMNGATNAVMAAGTFLAVAGETRILGFEGILTPSGLVEQVLSVRVGPNSGTMTLNSGYAISPWLGGAPRTTLVIEEIAP